MLKGVYASSGARYSYTVDAKNRFVHSCPQFQVGITSGQLRDVSYARTKRAIAPASAYATGLFVGPALADTWAGAEDDSEGDGEGVEIVAVEAGSVVVGGGATTVEDTGTMTEV
jgi:hypothetical protein